MDCNCCPMRGNSIAKVIIFKSLKIFRFTKKYYRNLTIRYNTLSLEGGITIRVKSVFQHPSYNPTSHENDIALVLTETNMTLNQMNADNANFPAMSLAVGMELNMTGWGNTQWGASGFSTNLQIANLVTSDKSDCNNTFGGMITTMLCAKSIPPYKCSTNGDRGGPGINSKILYGIIITWADCAMNQGYEVFTDVGLFYSWILATIRGVDPTTLPSI